MFNPFELENDRDYLIWRQQKLENYPTQLKDLIVEVGDPKQLTSAEHQAILQLCQKTNMALYASSVQGEDKEVPRKLGEQFGLIRLNHNWLADEDAITSLTVNDEGSHPQYIPYTNRAIKWHTDGYYNSADQQIWGLLLHCVQPAANGGENQLLDHEIAYIQIRDENPDYIRALMLPDAMTIPARPAEDGSDARAEESGPVFSVSPVSGNLHMRYTARTRSIVWKDDAVLKQAVAYLEQLLDSDLPWKFRGTLQAGMGLISNNVLHDRSGFSDTDDCQRLIYRARYFDRINDTDVRDVYA